MTAVPPPEPNPAVVCGPIDIACKTAQGIGNAVVNGADDAVTNLAEKVTTALGVVVKSLGTLWVNVKTPNLTGGGGGAETVAFLRDSLAPYMVALAIVSVMVGGARLAWERNGQVGKDLLMSLLTLVGIAGAAVAAISALVVAADGFSEWIIATSTANTDFGTNMTVLLGVLVAPANPLGALLVIVLGLVAVIASFVQIMLMVARAGMLVILAGVLPLTASFTTTATGKAWLRKSIGWTIAFIAYKPAAAVVYATAFRLTGSKVFGDDGSGLITLAAGLMLMLLALVALPALMRFVTPVVSQLSSGRGGGSGVGLALAAAAPTGAAAIVKMLRGGGSSSGAPSGSPPPASPSPDGGPKGSPPPSSPSPQGAPKSGSGPSGPGGGPGPAGTPGPATAGPAGGAATSGAASSAAGAGAGASAGAVAGPVGMVAGAALSGAVNLTKAAGGAARRTADDATGAGPDGSA